MKTPDPHESPDLEARLQQLPLRSVPSEWRAQILSQAKAGASSAPASNAFLASPQRPSSFSHLSDWLSALLWPSPKAWAGLAAAWLVLLTLNHSLVTSNAPTTSVVSMSKETLMIGREEQRLLAELIGPATDSATADRPKPGVPKPRSELHSKLINA